MALCVTCRHVFLSSQGVARVELFTPQFSDRAGRFAGSWRRRARPGHGVRIGTRCRSRGWRAGVESPRRVRVVRMPSTGLRPAGSTSCRSSRSRATPSLSGRGPPRRRAARGSSRPRPGPRYRPHGRRAGTAVHARRGCGAGLPSLPRYRPSDAGRPAR